MPAYNAAKTLRMTYAELPQDLVDIVILVPLQLRIHISGDQKQARVSVVVEIDNSRSPTGEPSLQSKAGNQGHIVEIALAVILIKPVRVVSEVSREKIQMAVQVEVADTKSHAGLFDSIVAQSSAAFQVERPIAIVHQQKTGARIASDENILASLSLDR